MYWIQSNAILLLLIATLSSSGVTWGLTQFKCWRGTAQAVATAKAEAEQTAAAVLADLTNESEAKMQERIDEANLKSEELAGDLRKSNVRYQSIRKKLREEVNKLPSASEVSAECRANLVRVTGAYQRLRIYVAQFNSGGGITGEE